MFEVEVQQSFASILRRNSPYLKIFQEYCFVFTRITGAADPNIVHTGGGRSQGTNCGAIWRRSHIPVSPEVKGMSSLE